MFIGKSENDDRFNIFDKEGLFGKLLFRFDRCKFLVYRLGLKGKITVSGHFFGAGKSKLFKLSYGSRDIS